MTVTFRPLALGEVLGLGRSIVRDFHPYELRGVPVRPMGGAGR